MIILPNLPVFIFSHLSSTQMHFNSAHLIKFQHCDISPEANLKYRQILRWNYQISHYGGACRSDKELDSLFLILIYLSHLLSLSNLDINLSYKKPLFGSFSDRVRRQELIERPIPLTNALIVQKGWSVNLIACF